MTDQQKLTLKIPSHEGLVVNYRGENLDMALLMMIAQIQALRGVMKAGGKAQAGVA